MGYEQKCGVKLIQVKLFLQIQQGGELGRVARTAAVIALDVGGPSVSAVHRERAPSGAASCHPAVADVRGAGQLCPAVSVPRSPTLIDIEPTRALWRFAVKKKKKITTAVASCGDLALHEDNGDAERAGLQVSSPGEAIAATLRLGAHASKDSTSLKRKAFKYYPPRGTAVMFNGAEELSENSIQTHDEHKKQKF